MKRSLCRGFSSCLPAAWRVVVGGAICLMLASAGGPALQTPAAQAVEPGQQAAANVDESLVVNCLLPGQIRRLGPQFTMLTARRPVKTTAQDCQTRSGFWQPLARGGDPSAPSYLNKGVAP
jgi:hypothetical protein